MVFRRERPRIRKILETLMSDYGWNIQELYAFCSHEYSDPESTVPFILTASFRIQARKMLDEEQQQEVVLNDTYFF